MVNLTWQAPNVRLMGCSVWKKHMKASINYRKPCFNYDKSIRWRNWNLIPWKWKSFAYNNNNHILRRCHTFCVGAIQKSFGVKSVSRLRWARCQSSKAFPLTRYADKSVLNSSSITVENTDVEFHWFDSASLLLSHSNLLIFQYVADLKFKQNFVRGDVVRVQIGWQDLSERGTHGLFSHDWSDTIQSKYFL